tara:strand:+ start:3704 stop:4030 length:327 start_codon:yes stop_codon:yes gene_type:complete
MPKINTLLPKEQAQKLVNLSKDLLKNDYKIAGKLYSILRTYCLTNKIQIKLCAKGRLQKIGVKINDQVVFAKPIIRNNEIVFFYKKRYYTTKELLNTVIKYNAYKNEV